MKSNEPRFCTIVAVIITCEPKRRMTFRFGFGGLLSFEESYAVEPVPVGSRLVHCFRCTGLLSALKLWKMKRNFSEMLEIIDPLFERYLGTTRPPASAKNSVRKGFRPNDLQSEKFGTPQEFGRA